MDRVRDVSKYPPKPFVTLFQGKVIQGHNVKQVQILKFVVWCDVIHVFRSDFRQERKKWH